MRTPVADAPSGVTAIECLHSYLGRYVLSAEHYDDLGAPEPLFCDNETNAVGLFGAPGNPTAYVKDGINNRVVHGDLGAVNPANVGTKAALWYRLTDIPPGHTVTVRLRLVGDQPVERTFGPDFDAVVADRAREADEFYDAVIPPEADGADRTTARRAFAGLLQNKQYYRYTLRDWLEGDPGQPPPPASRLEPGARNVSWQHLALAEVISMPDEWEYPWFASWDLAFHCVALAHVDPEFAKSQLIMLCREWAMDPSGQFPAYEWEFGDVNPPVHAWAAWQVYLIDGRRDQEFLRRMLPKLMLNFAWWLNRKDATGADLFEGGFLGMDNTGLFDRSKGLPAGAHLEQSDATSWMAFYCLQMLSMVFELAPDDRGWGDVAITFLEHFLSISRAMNDFGSYGAQLWDEQDRFFYDVLVHPDGTSQPLRVRSMVGLLPLLAVLSDETKTLDQLPELEARLHWLQQHRPDEVAALWRPTGETGAHPGLSLVGPERLTEVLGRMLDEGEFLSAHGIRALSACYREAYSAVVGGQPMTVAHLICQRD